MNTCGNSLLRVSSLLSDSSGNLSLVAVDFTLPVHQVVMLALQLSYTPNFLTHHLISEHSPVGLPSLLKLWLIPSSLDAMFDISSFNQTILLWSPSLRHSSYLLILATCLLLTVTERWTSRSGRAACLPWEGTGLLLYGSQTLSLPYVTVSPKWWVLCSSFSLDFTYVGLLES